MGDKEGAGAWRGRGEGQLIKQCDRSMPGSVPTNAIFGQKSD